MPQDLSDQLYTLHLALVAHAQTNIGVAGPIHFVAPADQALIDQIEVIRGRFDLPPIIDYAAIDVAMITAVGEHLARACYYSLVIYAAGKPPVATFGAMMTRRVANLKQKFFRGNVVEELDGSLRMSDGAASRIGYVWSMDGAFRIAFLTPCFSLVGHSLDAPRDAIATMASLLVGAQIANVTIISDFLKAYDWAIEMPSLRAEFVYLGESARMWESYDVSVRPFIKVLLRDQFKAFDGKKLARLTNLASYILGLSNANYNAYALHVPDPALITELRAITDRHMGQIGSNLRLTDRGLIDPTVGAAAAVVAGPPPPAGAAAGAGVAVAGVGAAAAPGLVIGAPVVGVAQAAP
jgi:hypothetical protein